MASVTGSTVLVDRSRVGLVSGWVVIGGPRVTRVDLVSGWVVIGGPRVALVSGWVVIGGPRVTRIGLVSGWVVIGGPLVSGRSGWVPGVIGGPRVIGPFGPSSSASASPQWLEKGSRAGRRGGKQFGCLALRQVGGAMG